VGPRNLAIHSHEFAKAAISESGDRALILAAKAMAFTCVDLFADREIFTQMKKELNPSV